MQPKDYSEAGWPVIRNAVLSGLRLHRPHTAYGLSECDVTDALAALRRCQRSLRMAVSFHAWLAYCLAQAAHEHPQVNTFRHRGTLITFHDVDVGTLVEKRLPDGTRIPVGYVLRAANHKSLAELNLELLAASRSELADTPEVRQRRRLAKLPRPVRRFFAWRMARSPFLLRASLGTIGLTSLRIQGAGRPQFGLPPNFFTATIAVGSITERCLPDAERRPVFRKVVCLSAGFDHAVIDGMDMARFVRRFEELLESAAGLDDGFLAETERLRAGMPS